MEYQEHSKVRVDGYDIIPATVAGSQKVFNCKSFTLQRTRWIEDEEVQSCGGCGNRFTQIRRRHHCRQCGNIFCGKCCSDKLVLIHLGMQEPERVCDGCKPYANFLTKAQEKTLNSRQEAAAALLQMITNPVSLLKVIELGGIQTLVYLAASSENYISTCVASSLHILAQHQSLYEIFVETGAIPALASILSETKENDSETVRNVMGTLHLFAKDQDMIHELMLDEVLMEIIRRCNKVSPSALIAVQTISLLARHQPARNILIHRCFNELTSIIELIKCKDEQMQITCLYILCNLSEDKEEFRDFIIKAEFSVAKPLLSLLRSPDKSEQATSYSMFLFANLAFTAHHQKLISDHIDVVCESIKSGKDFSEEVMTNIIRGLANVAQYPDNQHILMDHLSNITNVFLNSQVTFHRLHVMRLIFKLLYDNSMQVVSILDRSNDIGAVLEQMAQIPGVVTTVSNIFVNNAPAISHM